LLHAFVTSRMDYCNTILAGESPVYHRQPPASILHAAARVVSVSATRGSTTDRRLSHLLHDELHWLDVPRRVRTSCVQRSIATQSTTVHDGLLHPHLRRCSSAASAVRRLPSAVRIYRDISVRCSGLFCGWPGGTRYQTIRYHVPLIIFIHRKYGRGNR